MKHSVPGPQSPAKETFGADFDTSIHQAIHEHESIVRRISMLTTLLFLILIIVLVW